jgi:hypothetical protein
MFDGLKDKLESFTSDVEAEADADLEEEPGEGSTDDVAETADGTAEAGDGVDGTTEAADDAV